MVCAARVAHRLLEAGGFTLALCTSGLERDKFDNKTVSFEEHIKFEHNMWNYLYFIVLVRVKNKTDYTGPESYVAQMIKVWSWEVAVAACTDCGGLREGGTAVGTW